MTGLVPPGKPPAGTANVRPERKVFPASPEDGTVVIHSFLLMSYAVIAEVAVGENVMVASGTGNWQLMPEAVTCTMPPRRKIRTRPDPSPFALSTLLNQTESPAGMAVPLKFDVIELLPGGGPCNSANGFMAVGLCRLANCIDGTIGAIAGAAPWK